MLKDLYKNAKFLLASKSPRRRELLKSLEIDFEIVDIQSDENWPKELKREKITEFIALGKAEAYSGLKENEILIAADTIVWLDDQKIGKPKDEKDAFDMLSKLSGRTHEVFSSVCVKSTDKTVVFSETTEVTFDPISEDEINFYIRNYNPLDKAGSYGIQDWLGLCKISGIKGDYYNVMGLPLRKLYSVLTDF